MKISSIFSGKKAYFCKMYHLSILEFVYNNIENFEASTKNKSILPLSKVFQGCVWHLHLNHFSNAWRICLNANCNRALLLGAVVNSELTLFLMKVLILGGCKMVKDDVLFYTHNRMMCHNTHFSIKHYWSMFFGNCCLIALCLRCNVLKVL